MAASSSELPKPLNASNKPDPQVYNLELACSPSSIVVLTSASQNNLLLDIETFKNWIGSVGIPLSLFTQRSLVPRVGRNRGQSLGLPRQLELGTRQGTGQEVCRGGSPEICIELPWVVGWNIQGKNLCGPVSWLWTNSRPTVTRPKNNTPLSVFETE